MKASDLEKAQRLLKQLRDIRGTQKFLEEAMNDGDDGLRMQVLNRCATARRVPLIAEIRRPIFSMIRFSVDEVESKIIQELASIGVEAEEKADA